MSGRKTGSSEVYKETPEKSVVNQRSISDQEIIQAINAFRDTVHLNSREHGWYDEERSFGDIIALCHSELSEALEEYRKGESKAMRFYMGKPEGIGVELADCIIRILDYCGHADIDIGHILIAKHEYNQTRPYRHGGKVL
jgi:NTP pyrophosphatase (non-canonical NTP hydrolase)